MTVLDTHMRNLRLQHAEQHVQRAEEIIRGQRQRIEQLEKERRETADARHTLAIMERMRGELIEHRDRLAMEMAEYV